MLGGGRFLENRHLYQVLREANTHNKVVINFDYECSVLIITVLDEYIFNIELFYCRTVLLSFKPVCHNMFQMSVNTVRSG
jgi:hypothetical protein